MWSSYLRRHLRDRFSRPVSVGEARVALGIVGLLPFATGAWFLGSLLPHVSRSHPSVRRSSASEAGGGSTGAGRTEATSPSAIGAIGDAPASQSAAQLLPPTRSQASSNAPLRADDILAAAPPPQHPYAVLISTLLSDRAALVVALDDPRVAIRDCIDTHALSAADLWATLDAHIMRKAVAALVPPAPLNSPPSLQSSSTDARALELALRLFDDVLVPRAQSACYEIAASDSSAARPDAIGNAQRSIVAVHDCAARLALAFARRGDVASVQRIVRRVYDDVRAAVAMAASAYTRAFADLAVPRRAHCLAALAHALLLAPPSAGRRGDGRFSLTPVSVAMWCPWRDPVTVPADSRLLVPYVARLWDVSRELVPSSAWSSSSSSSSLPSSAVVSAWMQPVARACVRALCARGNSSVAVALLLHRALPETLRVSETSAQSSSSSSSTHALPSLASARALVADLDARSLALLLHNLAHAHRRPLSQHFLDPEMRQSARIGSTFATPQLPARRTGTVGDEAECERHQSERNASFAWRLLRAALPPSVADATGVSAIDEADNGVDADEATVDAVSDETAAAVALASSTAAIRDTAQTSALSSTPAAPLLSLEALTSLLSASAHAARIDRVHALLRCCAALQAPDSAGSADGRCSIAPPDAHMFDRLIRSVLAAASEAPAYAATTASSKASTSASSSGGDGGAQRARLWWLAVHLYAFARAQPIRLPDHLHRLMVRMHAHNTLHSKNIVLCVMIF